MQLAVLRLMQLLTSLADTLYDWWPHIITLVSLGLMVVASAHIVMYKKDTRAAIGWVGVVLLSPILGALAYGVLGINRVQRRAVERRPAHRSGQPIEPRRMQAAAHRGGTVHRYRRDTFSSP